MSKKPAAERFKAGDIIRYDDGSALFRFGGTVNAGRLYRDHVMGGACGRGDRMFRDLEPASEARSTNRGEKPMPRYGHQPAPGEPPKVPTTGSAVRPSAEQQLDFLAGEVRKAVAIFDRVDLRAYFDRLAASDPLAEAIAAASEHLAPALNIIGRRHAETR